MTDHDQLWTPDDCARYLGIARWTFVNRVSKMPTFPAPYVELSRRMRRWLPADVKEWCHRTGRHAVYPSFAAISSAVSS